MQVNSPKKVLVFRLSSLGDVILATAVLHRGVIPGAVDWVVAAEFAPILRGHPGIGKLWEFDRSKGLAGWLELCAELSKQGYDEVLDLHGSLRTRLARGYFAARWGRGRKPRWRRISKGRWRLYGLYLLKNRWPAAWRPRSFTQRFARFAGGRGDEKPDLTHLPRLAGASGGDALAEIRRQLRASGLQSYYCVMPGSKWPGKCWAPEKYLEVIRGTPGAMPVILGGARDPGSAELAGLLERAGLPHVSGAGKWDLPLVAAVLASAQAYLGNDTGLAHLGEALGVPALVVYGPTTPEMGFAPWRAESRSVGLSGLGCRPCGKDGRRCYRPRDKYLCMNGLDAATVAARFREVRDGGNRPSEGRSP